MPFIRDNDPGIPDISKELVITAYVFMILCPLFVVARWSASRYLCERSKGKGFAKVGADEWWLIATTPWAIAGTALMIFGAHCGFGNHIDDIVRLPNGMNHVRKAFQIFYASQILYAIIMGMTKVAVLMFYVRTFGSLGANKRFVTACRVMIWFVALFTVVSAYQSMAQCLPFELAWSGSKEDMVKHCINFEAYWYSRAGLNILTDSIIALLPIFVVHKLQMSTKKKWMVCGMFALGFNVVAVAIARTFTIETAALRSDPTWHAVHFCTLSVVENGLSMIIACLPPLPKALSMCFHRHCWWLSETSSTHCQGSQVSQERLVEKGFAGSISGSSVDREMAR